MRGAVPPILHTPLCVWCLIKQVIYLHGVGLGTVQGQLYFNFIPHLKMVHREAKHTVG
jgi:hypothetical protein